MLSSDTLIVVAVFVNDSRGREELVREAGKISDAELAAVYNCEVVSAYGEVVRRFPASSEAAIDVAEDDPALKDALNAVSDVVEVAESRPDSTDAALEMPSPDNTVPLLGRSETYTLSNVTEPSCSPEYADSSWNAVMSELVSPDTSTV